MHSPSRFSLAMTAFLAMLRRDLVVTGREIVAFLLVLFFVPATLLWQASAFLVFRLFDIYKPPPIRYYERTFKNGFGVMLDDLVAAFYTLVIFAVAKIIMA